LILQAGLNGVGIAAIASSLATLAWRWMFLQRFATAAAMVDGLAP